jgi:hypothetical protein
MAGLADQYLDELRRRERQQLLEWLETPAEPIRTPSAPIAPVQKPAPPEALGVAKEFGYGLARGGAGLMGSLGTLLKVGGWALDSETIKTAGEAIATEWSKTAAAYQTPASQQFVWDNPAALLSPAWWASSIGETVLGVAASLIPGVGAAKYLNVAGTAMKWSPKLVARLARLGGLATGGSIGGFLEGSSTYETVLARGGTDEEAFKSAALFGLMSAGLNAVGMAKAIPGATETAGLLRRGVAGGALDALTEWLEAPAEALVLREDPLKAALAGLNVAPPAFLLGGLGAAAFGGARRAPGVPATPAAEAAAAAPPAAPGAPLGAPAAAPPVTPTPAVPGAPAAVPGAPTAVGREAAPVTGAPAFPPAGPLPALSVGAAGAGTLATGQEARVNTRFLDTDQLVKDQIEVANATPAPEVLATRGVRTTAELKGQAARAAFTVEDALQITPDSRPLLDYESVRLRQYMISAVDHMLTLKDNVRDGVRAREWDLGPAITLAGRLVDAVELDARKVARALQSRAVMIGETAATRKAIEIAERAEAEQGRVFEAPAPEEMALLRRLDEALAATTSEADLEALRTADMPERGQAAKLTENQIRQIADLAELLQGQSGVTPRVIADQIETLARHQMPTYIDGLLARSRALKAAGYEYYYNALLSGPVTHTATTASNTLMTFWAIPERALASRLTWTSRDVTSAHVQKGEAMAMLHALVTTWQDALKFAAVAWREGREQIPTLREGQLVARPQAIGRVERIQPAITAEALGLEGSSWAGAVNMLGAAIRTPSRLMLTGDAFFKALNFRMELDALAIRRAAAAGLEGDAFTAKVTDLQSRPTAEMLTAAQDFALYQVLQQDPGGAVRGIMTAANQTPFGRVVLPFIKTPANSLMATFERLPGLNFLVKQSRADLLAGGTRRELALAKLTLGGLTVAAIATMAASGMVTGGGPRDPDLRRELQATGWQPYSLKIGGRYFAYNRLDPIGAILGVVARATEVMGELDEGSVTDIAVGVVMGTMRYTLDKSWLEGLANVVEALERPERGIERWVRRNAASLVPTLFAQVGRTLDPTLREAQTLVDAMHARVPGWSETLPPRRNIFGDPIRLGGGWGPDLISPVFTSMEKDDPVANEMARLRVNLSMPQRVLNGTGPTPVGHPATGREGVPLSPQQYDTLVRYAGNENKFGGLGMKDALERLFESDRYRALPSDAMRSDEVRRIVTTYREAAKRRLISEDPVLRQSLAYHQADREARRRGLAGPEALAGSLGR